MRRNSILWNEIRADMFEFDHVVWRYKRRRAWDCSVVLPSLPASVASVALQMMFAVAVIVSLFCSVLFCLMNILQHCTLREETRIFTRSSYNTLRDFNVESSYCYYLNQPPALAHYVMDTGKWWQQRAGQANTAQSTCKFTHQLPQWEFDFYLESTSRAIFRPWYR